MQLRRRQGRADRRRRRELRPGDGGTMLALVRKVRGHSRVAAGAPPRRPAGGRALQLPRTSRRARPSDRGADLAVQPGLDDGRCQRPVPGTRRRADLRRLRAGRATTTTVCSPTPAGAGGCAPATASALARCPTTKSTRSTARWPSSCESDSRPRTFRSATACGRRSSGGRSDLSSPRHLRASTAWIGRSNPR